MNDTTNAAHLTMQAISQDELGGPEVLKSVTLPRPTPGLGEILVRVHAAGVNPVDSYHRQGLVPLAEPPFVVGFDVSGTVEAVGLGVTLYRPGDEVFGMLPFTHGHGAYAQYAVGPARAFVPKPEGLDHVQAAALPLAGLTAWQALVDTAAIGEGSRVLINGAAGGVGHLAVQIAKAHGAYVIALTSAQNADFVRSLGADEVLDYTTTDIATAVKDLDAVLESVGGDYPAKEVKLLKPGGTLIATLPPMLAPIAEEAAQRGIRLAAIFVEADRLGMTALADLAASGRLTPAIAATYPLEQAGAAQSTKTQYGKTVLTLT
ncbi:NADP-dependent oxidoreductase [Streptomyces sp. NBC_01637]|uniref:NADP-dependent oxidoreductase n=1 Tax=unclassified Streptomyces TaxID=2593676 RepID=UPI00386EDE1D|nr:NADP-dependent oxidoreductase [Streptomyces sp. NBC_01653]WTC84490.1 NADP-dependent oxidoreductase [Streptomyces sp. NBC_01653]WTD86377.1 NADP-dependent oxidoreductase [Streptomyces sp. NBC_01637]WTD94147.1 NADP-dependent oxidoreductase [Streptomyces sp. NBC_01637]